MLIMPTDELCRVDRTSLGQIKRIDAAPRHNKKRRQAGRPQARFWGHAGPHRALIFVSRKPSHWLLPLGIHPKTSSAMVSAAE